MKTYIEFKKQRELGEIFSDTFAFIRNEYKPLFKTIISIAGPYLLFFLFALVFYIYTIGGQFKFDFTNPESNAGLFSGANALMFVLAYFVYITAAILAYIFTVSTVLHYMKTYEENKSVVNLQEIRDHVNRSFWGFLGLTILKVLTLIVACVICCIPVLYFMVPMAVVMPIYVFTKRDATDSYSESYSLIKDEFLMTFLTVLLLWILVIVLSSIFALPATIYTYIKMGVFSGEIDPTSLNSIVDPVYIILNVLSQFFQFLSNIVIVISSVFIYFNLNERKNFTGTFERIESLGKTE